MSTSEPNEATPPAPQQPAATVKPDTARLHMLIAWLVLALAVVIVAVGTSPFWAPTVVPVLPWGTSPAAVDRGADAIRDLATRLDADEAALKRHAAQLSRLGAVELTLKDQAARLAQLEARPPPAAAPEPQATLSTPAAPSPESAEAIKALQDQVAKLTASTAATGDRVAAVETQIRKAGAGERANQILLTALANLRVAVEGSGPFAAELAAAQAAAGDKPGTTDALSALGDDAKAGLPTTAALAERFDRVVAPAILRAPRDDANAGLWQQIRARVERLVVIRRMTPGGPAPRDTVEAAIVNADAALKAGDLAGAAGALNALTGGAGNAVAPWLAQAKKRVAAETTLAKLWHDEMAKAGANP
jgi:hypothetical protein